MKITFDISDSLYDEARRVAHYEKTTLKALIEEGLRHILAERKRHVPFTLRKGTFKGKGLQPAFSGAPWTQIRDSAYEGAGNRDYFDTQDICPPLISPPPETRS